MSFCVFRPLCFAAFLSREIIAKTHLVDLLDVPYWNCHCLFTEAVSESEERFELFSLLFDI